MLRHPRHSQSYSLDSVAGGHQLLCASYSSLHHHFARSLVLTVDSNSVCLDPLLPLPDTYRAIVSLRSFEYLEPSYLGIQQGRCFGDGIADQFSIFESEISLDFILAITIRQAHPKSAAVLTRTSRWSFWSTDNPFSRTSSSEPQSTPSIRKYGPSRESSSEVDALIWAEISSLRRSNNVGPRDGSPSDGGLDVGTEVAIAVIV